MSTGTEEFPFQALHETLTDIWNRLVELFKEFNSSLVPWMSSKPGRWILARTSDPLVWRAASSPPLVHMFYYKRQKERRRVRRRYTRS